MRFKTHDSNEFEIPTEWLKAVGLFPNPVLDGNHFVSNNAEQIIDITRIKSPTRAPGTPLLFPKEMMPILRGFVARDSIPPIEVTVPSKRSPFYDERFEYRVWDGCHRYHASIAVGFLQIPIAVIDHSRTAFLD